MDRSLQERLVGAVVLVALAVWLIPQVLDGPGDGDRHSVESLTLPAPAQEPGLRTQTIRLDAKRAAPAPMPRETDTGGRAASAAKPASQPVAVASGSAGKIADTPTPAAGDWFVQLGSFAERANASKLAATVAELGFQTEVSRHTAGSQLLHRVRVGPRPSRVAAEALASDLARRGFKGQVVPDG